jgi:uncharacterized protein with LGFP repeats
MKSIKNKLVDRSGKIFTLITMTAVAAFINANAAQGPLPSICNRACWGARNTSCSGNLSVLNRAIIHHTAGAGDWTTNFETAKSKVRGVQNLHMDGNGWCDTGYHFLVSAGGHIFEGRKNSMAGLPKGAHDGCNANSFGFNVLGYYHPPYNHSFTSAARGSLEAVMAWRMPSSWSPYGTSSYCSGTIGVLDGHYRVKSTSCPGDGIIPQIGGIRDGVNARKNSGGCDINMTQGSIRAKYESLGGCSSYLGSPTTYEFTCADGVGKGNNFQRGSIFWRPDLGAHNVQGSIHTKWAEKGADLGYLGYPTSDELDNQTGGKFNNFERGTIFWRPDLGAHSVWGDIYAKWAQKGADLGYLGYPTTDELDNQTGGKYNNFERGTIFWRPDLGAHDVQGDIYGKWSQLGADLSYLGYPTTDELNNQTGGKYSNFERGTIFWRPDLGAHNVQGSIYTKWSQLGADLSYLGYPVSDEGNTATGGKYNNFERGAIFWKQSIGIAYGVQGAIYNKWVELGADTGCLGYPISDEYDWNGGKRSDFEGGSITWTSAGGAVSTCGSAPPFDTIVDNNSANFSVVGAWTTGTGAADKYGPDYRFRSTAAVNEPATWTTSLPAAATYRIFAWWSVGANRSGTAPYVITHSGGTTTVNMNQQALGGQWNTLGNFNIGAGNNSVKLSCWTTTGFVVIADAVRWQRQ